MNRREMIGAVAGLIGYSQAGSSQPEKVWGDKLLNYADVGQATMTEPGKGPVHYWFEVNGRWVEVDMRTYYGYMAANVFPERFKCGKYFTYYS